jgi:hypothetical protein
VPLNAVAIRDPIIADDLKGVLIYQPYEVFDDDGTGKVNPNGLIDPNTAISVPQVPAKGTPHPNYPQAIVTTRRLQQVISNASVIVMVAYRSYGLYHGGPRAISEASGDQREIELPVWNRYTDAGIVNWIQDKDCSMPRNVSVRTETRFIVGNSFALVQKALALNVGQLFTIDGDLYRLSGQSSAYYDGTQFTRVNYRFERDAAIPVIPVGTLGNDVAIPALPALYLWASRPDPISSATPPTILAVPPRAVLGGPPAFPALPGFP